MSARYAGPSVALLGGVVLLACACGPSKSDPAPAASSPAQAPSTAQAHDQRAVAPAPAHRATSPEVRPDVPVVTVVRVAALTGSPRRDDTEVVVGERLQGGAVLRLANGDRVSLDVAQSGRVELEGETRLLLGADDRAQVFLARGVASINVPPAGDGTLVSQRVVTPRATFSFRPGTVGVVATHEGGEVSVHVLSGRVEVHAHDADTGPVDPIEPASAKRFDARGGVTALKPGEDLSATLVKARALVRGALKVRERPADALRDAQRSVEGSVSALSTERDRGAALQVEHTQAIAVKDAAGRSTKQRELAAHGQRMFAARRQLLAAWEWVQVSALRVDDPAAVRGEVSTLHSRIAALLPAP